MGDYDEVLSSATCPECRVSFGHASNCIDETQGDVW